MTNTTNTTKAARITKTMRFEDIASMLKGEAPVNGTNVAEALEFIAHEQALLAKKNQVSGERKQTPTQVANEGYKAQIAEYLAENPKQTCSAIIKGIPEFAGFSTSKVNALLRQLQDSHEVIREEVKGKALFSLSTVE